MEQTVSPTNTEQNDKVARRKISPEERAEKAKQRLERAKKCVSMANKSTRKFEARKNFVIGAALQEMAAKDWKFGKAMKQLVAKLEERDRPMFDSFVYAVEEKKSAS